MTYNLIGVPKSNVDAFSVEISTLDSEFVEKAHDYGKKFMLGMLMMPIQYNVCVYTMLMA